MPGITAWIGIPWVVQDPQDLSLGKASLAWHGDPGHPAEETRKVLAFYSTNRGIPSHNFSNVVTNTQNQAHKFTDKKMNM